MPKCEDCGREFASDAALAQHLKDKHGVESPSAVKQQGSENGAKASKKQKSLRKRNRHPVAIALIAVAVVVGVGLYFTVGPALAAPPVPCSSGETWIHMHPYLSIQIENQSVAVPADIGFLQGGTCLEVMHTHDASGIIHIELAQNDKNANYTLSDFFRVWNATFPTISINGTSHPVVFTNADIFGYKADATHKVIVLVDGKQVPDGVHVPLEQLDYCNATNGSVAPCAATANGDPLWDGGASYPYGTGHTIVIEYVSA